jgi:hypothetical protein
MKALLGPGVVLASAAVPSSDPLGTDDSMFSPSPDWLFPAVMGLFGVGLAIVLVLLIRWSRARRKSAPLMQKGHEDQRD